MDSSTELFSEMDMRSREVFQRIVESYLSSGEPMGSNTLTQQMSQQVSAATIRNVMKDLEFLGLLDSPHTSAGRRPTEMGLRLFVDGLLEVGDINTQERKEIDASLDHTNDMASVLDKAGTMLSGLTQGASVVMAPKSEAPIKHIEFVSLAPDRALVVLVTEDGNVENRMFNPPLGQTPSSMREAANFLNSIVFGHTISEGAVKTEIAARRQEIDTLAHDLVESGLAVWQNKGDRHERLLVRGRANLLDGDAEEADLTRIRTLFDDLERKRDIAEFLELTEEGEGVRIFIGSENKLFSLTGSSLVVSPYMNADRKVVGAIGVIGPTRLNYGRIVPIVNYTAQMVGRVLSDRG